MTPQEEARAALSATGLLPDPELDLAAAALPGGSLAPHLVAGLREHRLQPLPARPPLVEQAARDLGLADSPLGSNAWAFGKDVTANGKGMLLGNPHFPWVGTSRFYQMHLTIPGQMDVMGASIGLSGVVQIGFNKDVAWSHTVSTGKRFTLHELALVPGQPTKYLVDNLLRSMQAKTVQYRVKGANGQVATKTHTVWNTHLGPVLVMPKAGLNWNGQVAYALQDANAGGLRSTETYLAFAKARRVEDLHQALGNLGTSWVNTIAADRHGHTLYADMSVVPDVDAAQLQRCAPSKGAAALLPAAGLVVLNGSRTDCDWNKDPASPVPGLTPPSRMPSVVRTDWVHNSNDSFFYTHPGQRFSGIGPPISSRPPCTLMFLTRRSSPCRKTTPAVRMWPRSRPAWSVAFSAQSIAARTSRSSCSSHCSVSIVSTGAAGAGVVVGAVSLCISASWLGWLNYFPKGNRSSIPKGKDV